MSQTASPSEPATTASPVQAVEAILMTSEKPVPPARIVDALDAVGVKATSQSVETAVADLNDSYDQTDRSFRIERVAGGFRMMAIGSVAPVLAAFHGARESSKLSRAALETLAVVAYRQPVTRAEVESIRGVAAGDVLRSLMDRRFVTIVGRAEELGRPMLYGTTKEFLNQFGLSKVGDLPPAEGARPLEEPSESAEQASAEQVSAEPSTDKEGNNL